MNQVPDETAWRARYANGARPAAKAVKQPVIRPSQPAAPPPADPPPPSAAPTPPVPPLSEQLAAIQTQSPPKPTVLGSKRETAPVSEPAASADPSPAKSPESRPAGKVETPKTTTVDEPI